MHRRSTVLALTAVAGIPALAPFTPLLEPLRDHLKLLSLISFLFYLFAPAYLAVLWFLIDRDSWKDPEPPTG